MRMKRTQWQEVVDVNLTGVYLCSQVRPPPATFLLQLFLSTGMRMHVTGLPPPPGCSDADDEEEEGIHVTNYPPREPAGRSLLIRRT